MNKDLYNQIFRRKSFHTFQERSNEFITNEELDDIYKAYKSFESLNGIETDIKIVKTEETTCNRKADYCIMLFSKKEEGYLQNIGYLGEQLDLYLVSRNIGSLWFGIAKSNEVYHGLDYVVMIAIDKVSSFRKDMYKAERKTLEDIWQGDDLNVANVARFSPSACNSQPWFVENKDNQLYVYRKSKSGRVGIMPKNASIYFNQIDIGIFMCILEICLLNEGYSFDRTLQKDDETLDTKVLNAIYKYKKV